MSLDPHRAPLKDLYPHLKAPRFKFGEGSYGGIEVMDFGGGGLEIGNYSSFSFGVKIILGGEHRIDWGTTFPFTELWPDAPKVEGHPATKGDIKIGSDVWVGAEAMILSGVTIGDGAVVAARSVVTKDVRPYQVVGGSPAKPIDWRFDLETIDRLLAIRWWDWPRERVVKALPLLLQPRIGNFLEEVEKGRL